MQDILKELMQLHEQKKKAGIFQIRPIIDKQMSIIEKMIRDEDLERKIVTKLIKRLLKMDRHEEFDISLEEYKRILKEKVLEEHAYILFAKNIEIIRRLMGEAKLVLESQKKDVSDYTTIVKEMAHESEIYNQMIMAGREIKGEEAAIKQYFNDMKELKHSKKYLGGARVMTKIIRRILFRMEVSGRENIPMHGPCIIAPHHINSAFDPIIITSVMPRPIFYLGSVEPFVASSLIARIYDKIGVLPFKRSDSQYGTPKQGAQTEEELHKYPSSNKGTITSIMKYLRYGNAVVIFPEGDTSKFGRYIRPDNEEFIRPHSGFIDIILMIKKEYGIDIQIVPVGLAYTKGAFDTNAFSSAKVNIGKPFIIPTAQIMNEPSIEEKKRMKEYYMNYFFEEIKRLSSIARTYPNLATENVSH